METKSFSTLSATLSNFFIITFLLIPYTLWLLSFMCPLMYSNNYHLHTNWASLVDQRLQRLPTMQESLVWSLGWEYPLEKEMATHSSILDWEIPWMQEPGGLQSREESDMT